MSRRHRHSRPKGKSQRVTVSIGSKPKLPKQPELIRLEAIIAEEHSVPSVTFPRARLPEEDSVRTPSAYERRLKEEERCWNLNPLCDVCGKAMMRIQVYGCSYGALFGAFPISNRRFDGVNWRDETEWFRWECQHCRQEEQRGYDAYRKRLIAKRVGLSLLAIVLVGVLLLFGAYAYL
jgi:hypothetical protein